ncbi:Pkinase-domain-containing protein, partial [Meira miltonrushii]
MPPPKAVSAHTSSQQKRPQPSATSSREGKASSSSQQSRTQTSARGGASEGEPRPSSRLANEKKKDYKDPPFIGPWKLGKLIGQGASGRVRHAVNTSTGLQAAIKIVPKQILAHSRMSIGDVTAKQDKMTLGIEREIVIMKLIEHPNVLGLMDVYETSKELYLILEYVAGGELFDYLVSKGRLRAPEARAYFRQIIFGLHYCHSFNICHRDLKPENLLLDGSKRMVKVADFGMAALQPNEKMLETSCGSPHYASPEIVSGKSYKGTASDIWSCGIILFALLCGRLPFDDPNIQTLLGKVRLGKFDMPDYLERDAKDLISKMLTVDPEKRLKMRDIMRHPWFTDNGQLSSTNPVSTDLDKLAEEELDMNNLDMDILSNLKTLWPEFSQQDIIEQLMSKGPNWQKTFYSLL